MLAEEIVDCGTDEDTGDFYAGIGDALAGEIPDPVSIAVKELFGLSYLFPYQRLVISNILEAAQANGVAIRWPPQVTARRLESAQTACDGGERAGGGDEPAEDDDRGSLGRQIVILPTGAGKSLCFQLPAMLLDGPTLVIYPILSLMSDQDRRLTEKNFVPVTLRGGQSREDREHIFQKIKSGESRFIIANPRCF